MLVEIATVAAQFPHWYELLKFWLPIITGFTLVYKAGGYVKKTTAEFLHTLLNNHLTHIQDATMMTVTETKKTNDLLAAQALQSVTVARHVEQVKTSLSDHTDKEMQVWNGVVNTLAVLEDRTRRRTSTKRKR